MAKQRIVSLFMIVMAFAMALSALNLTASAHEPVQTELPCQITIQYEHEKQALAGTTFRLFRVADISPSAVFTLTGDFSSYPVRINGLNAAGLTDAANTLAVYAVADALTPMKTGKTDAGGRLIFSDLKPGLYLLLGDAFEHGGEIFTPAPVLVSLPSVDEKGDFHYDVIMQPKTEVKPIPSAGETVTRRVIKVWDDRMGTAKKRPESVTIELLRDGQVADVVTLSAENDWSFTWDKLDARSVWSVVERNVPQGYTVLYFARDTILRVTNTCLGGEEPSTEPTTQPTTEDPSAGGGGHEKTTKSPSGGGGNGGGKLPQTGQLWWPVPVSAGLGLLLFGLGWFFVFRKRTVTDEK